MSWEVWEVWGVWGEGCRYDRGYARELPYPERSFDVIRSSLMLHHLEREQKLAMPREVRRVLRLDGALYQVDFGGRKEPADPWPARSPRVRAQRGAVIPELSREAGFREVTELGGRTGLFGRIASYRAAG